MLLSPRGALGALRTAAAAVERAGAAVDAGAATTRSSRPHVAQRLKAGIFAGVTTSIRPLQCGHFVMLDIVIAKR